MRMNLALFGMVLLSYNLSPFRSQNPDTNALPASWDVNQIEKDAPNSVVPGRFYVLAWHASAWTYMGKEYRRESCLALRVFGNDKPERWDLYHLYREPLERDSRWRVSMHHATGGDAGPTGRWYFHVKDFKSRPGNKDIYDSLSMSSTGVNWKFERGGDCVGCGVCEKNWQEAIGEKPTQFFPQPAKKMGNK
ncbi:MAG TPA: hypothetical protein VE988_29840 [Gemmataceae bacterium]|nr:hypothetical protein [Gemmataceae bacterium]